MTRRMLLVPLCLLAACDIGSSSGNDAHLIAVLPYTGTYELKGPVHEAAVRMALEELVEAGAHDRMDRRFNVVPVNSGDGKDVVEQLVRDVVDELGDDVLGIVSSTGDAHEGSARVALDLGIPHFETSSGAHDEEFVDWSAYSEDELSYLMSSRALCNYEAIYTAEFIMQRWPTGRVALFRGDKTHDKMHTQVIREQLEAMGFAGTVIESNDPALAGESDPSNRDDFLLSYEALEAGGVEAEISAVIAEHQPDVVFFHLRGDTPNLRFMQDSQRVGYGGAIVTCGMARTSSFIDPNENGLISDYLVGNDVQLPEDRFFFVMRAPEPGPMLDSFKEDYEKDYELAPDTFTASVYDAAMLWGLGVLSAESFTREDVLKGIVESSREGAPVSRSDLGEAVLRTAQGEDVDYVGASGPMDVRADRTVPGSYYIERVARDGSSYKYEELTTPARVLK